MDNLLTPLAPAEPDALKQALHSCQQGAADIDVLLRAIAVLAGRARALLDETLDEATTDLAEAVEDVACEVEHLVSCATTLANCVQTAQHRVRQHLETATLMAREEPASHAEAAFATARILNERRTGLGHSEKTLKRLVACTGETLREMYSAVQALQPTARQLAAVDELVARLGTGRC
jgi:ABC-type transporter Mla subunit MlaD